MKQNQSKYGICSNIIYALKNIWNWDKGFFLYFLPSIPLTVVLSLATNYFPKILIDAVTVRENITTILGSIFLYFGGLFLISLFQNFCQSRLQMRQYTISLLYQHAIDEKYMKTDYVNTDSPKANIKYQNAMNDACSGQCAPEFIWQSLLQLAISLLGIVTYGSLIATISPIILFFLFLSAAITYFVGRFQRNYMEKNKDSKAAVARKINYLHSFSEKFDYAKDIRLYGMSDWIFEMLTGLQNEQFSWIKKEGICSLAGSIVQALLLLIQNGAAYAVLIVMIQDGSISAGDFVFYFGTITGFSAWLNGIGSNINDLIHKSIRIGYYREYFDMEETYNHAEGCALPNEEELPVEIVFSDVSYAYSSVDEDKYALKNINLTIRKGEKLAIVGPNGAGKTTLIKLLCGFYYPLTGTITLNNHAITEYNIESYYSLFSAVFQDIYLLPVTIAEFIASGKNEINRTRVQEVLKKAGLEEKIKSLPNGIDSRLMKGVFEDSIELSGGEKQKLMLARALYKDAPVIVLDEPTAALDPIAENELYLQYNKLTKDKTSIYISHRLASTRFCDRIIYIENGQIIESGSHDELMKLGGKYAHMFALQSNYYKENDYE